MNRDEAWAIVTEYTASDSLRKHMLSVEAAMRAYAPRYEGDAELWGVVGLLHDSTTNGFPMWRSRAIPWSDPTFCVNAV